MTMIPTYLYSEDEELNDVYFELWQMMYDLSWKIENFNFIFVRGSDYECSPKIDTSYVLKKFPMTHGKCSNILFNSIVGDIEFFLQDSKRKHIVNTINKDKTVTEKYRGFDKCIKLLKSKEAQHLDLICELQNIFKEMTDMKKNIDEVCVLVKMVYKAGDFLNTLSREFNNGSEYDFDHDFSQLSEMSLLMRCLEK